MYTIAVEVHAFAQLERLQPALLEDLSRQCIAAAEIQGGSYLSTSAGVLLFRFRQARPEDHNSVVECLEQLAGILKARESELAGWNVYVEYLQAPDDEVGQIIKDRMALVSEDDCAWIGPDAFSLLGHYLQLEEVHFGTRLYHRVLRSDSDTSLPSNSVEQLAESDTAVDAILDLLDPNTLTFGAILVYGEDRHATRVNSILAAETLAGDASALGRIEFEARDDSTGYGPLLSGLAEIHLHETRFWLTDSEKPVWDERLPLLQYLMHPLSDLCLPDRLAADLVCALEHYISAYVRRAVEGLAPPILLCHEIDNWPPVSVEVLSNILRRFEETTSGRAPLVLVTSQTATTPAALRPLVQGKVRLPRLSAAKVREASAAIAGERVSLNWERLYRVTGSKSDSVLHYLTASSHWDLLSEDELGSVSAHDLAARVVGSLEPDVQEALLGICCAGKLLKSDDLLELLTELGIDRVRVTAIVARLRSLGLIRVGNYIEPQYPRLAPVLEAELGSSAATVFNRIASACERFLSDGRIVITEQLLKLFHNFQEGSQVPRFYHLLVGRFLDERELNQAHRLLYDAVPTNGFASDVRKCMQAVLYTNRLRLALLQGNIQEAERVRAAAERVERPETCFFVEGDLTLERARLCARTGSGREAQTLTKHAIMIYQDAENAAGLARGNLDFGLLLLAQEDVLEAREYFQLASKMASSSGNLFEQIRADALGLTSTFVDGNYSRVLGQASALSDRAAHAAMREVQLWSEFVAARALFELGRYEDAAAGFDRGRSRSRFYGWAPPGDLFRRWLARALVYDDRVRRGIAMLCDEPEGREAQYFLGEAWLRFGDNGKALAALDRALDLPGPSRCSLESIAWNTGYAGLEDRAIGVFEGGRVMDHLLVAMRGFVLAESGRLEEGVEEMHRLTREGGLSDIDPFNRLYYYIYSLILPESGDLSIEDRGTVLGRAVRYIQERTSRLDEYRHKTDFLRLNYWNNRLMSHAQSSNLV